MDTITLLLALYEADQPRLDAAQARFDAATTVDERAAARRHVVEATDTHRGRHVEDMVRWYGEDAVAATIDGAVDIDDAYTRIYRFAEQRRSARLDAIHQTFK